eukprot:3289091-Rhodomonas_salina.1
MSDSSTTASALVLSSSSPPLPPHTTARVDLPLSGESECAAGYELVTVVTGQQQTASCVACVAGYFKPSTGNTTRCTPCPK